MWYDTVTTSNAINTNKLLQKNDDCMHLQALKPETAALDGMECSIFFKQPVVKCGAVVCGAAELPWSHLSSGQSR